MAKVRFKANDYVRVPSRFGDYDYQIVRMHRDASASLICVSPGVAGLQCRVDVSRLVFLDLSKPEGK